MATLLLSACAGMKVIHPNDPRNEGTLAVDTTGGGLKLVETYTCTLVGTGKRHSAIGKSEDEARTEVVAKCRDHTAISFCDVAKAKCVKN